MSWPRLVTESLGTFEFISIAGFEPAREQVEILKRPNMDGVAIRFNGTTGEPKWCRAYRDLVCPNEDALQITLATYLTLNGQVVTFYDDHEQVFTHVVIEQAFVPSRDGGRPNPSRVINASGGFHGSNATHVVAVTLGLVHGDF